MTNRTPGSFLRPTSLETLLQNKVESQRRDSWLPVFQFGSPNDSRFHPPLGGCSTAPLSHVSKGGRGFSLRRSAIEIQGRGSRTLCPAEASKPACVSRLPNEAPRGFVFVHPRMVHSAQETLHTLLSISCALCDHTVVFCCCLLGLFSPRFFKRPTRGVAPDLCSAAARRFLASTPA